jgi:hypothetical protein
MTQACILVYSPMCVPEGVAWVCCFLATWRVRPGTSDNCERVMWARGVMGALFQQLLVSFVL